jgi:hypothetical protein
MDPSTVGELGGKRKTENPLVVVLMFSVEFFTNYRVTYCPRTGIYH